MLPRIEQRFGSWLDDVRVAAEGDMCEIRSGGQHVHFRLADVTRVMVSVRTGFLVPKHSRIIHLLGGAGEVARLECNCRPAHTQAAATFVRHLIQERKRSGREHASPPPPPTPNAAPQLAIGNVPSSRDRRTELVTSRPRFWEFLLFAEVLSREMERIEPKWRRYSGKGARPAGPILSDHDVFQVVSTLVRRGQADIDELVNSFESYARQAFGAPGSPGDPTQIEYVATWWASKFEDLLDLVIATTDAPTSTDIAPLAKASVALFDGRIRQLYAWFERTLIDIAHLRDDVALAPGQKRSLDLSLRLRVDDEAAAWFNREADRYVRLVDAITDALQQPPS